MDAMKDLAIRTCCLTGFKLLWVGQIQRKGNHRWAVFTSGMEGFGLSLSLSWTSRLPPSVSRNMSGEGKELMAVAFGSTVDQVDLGYSWLITAKVRLQTLHSLEIWAPPNGLQSFSTGAEG